MNKTANQPEALLSWMGTLSDPTRLRLLRLLERHELGVAELCDVLQLPQSTVSRHLKVLGDEGWVKSRAEGTTRFYRMIEDKDGAPRLLWTIAREETGSWATLGQDQLRLTRRLAARRPAAEAFFAGAAGEWDRRHHTVWRDSNYHDPFWVALRRKASRHGVGWPVCGLGRASVPGVPRIGSAAG